MRAWVFLAVTACGRIGFEPRGPQACTTVDVADDFDDGIVSTQWYRYAQSTVGVVETGGQLVITPVADQDGSHYGGYISRAFVDMRDHCIFATLVATPADTGAVEMQLAVQLDTRYTGLSVGNAHLETFTNFDGTPHTLALTPHDAIAHRIVRIRESAGTTYWETSPDGATFTEQHAAATPFDFSAVQVLIQAGTFAAVANPGTAVFDDFDTPP